MNVENHPVVSREEWLAARKQHLAEEKAFTKERDRLSAKRRALPWVKVDKDYRFHGSHGELKLADLFGKHSQLIVYHFMFAKDWEEGCQGCSFLSDHIDGAIYTWPTTTSPWSRSPTPRLNSSRPSSGVWAGNSTGCRQTVPISTTTLVFAPALKMLLQVRLRTTTKRLTVPRKKCPA